MKLRKPIDASIARAAALSCLLVATLLCGCTPLRPLKGGRATTLANPAGGLNQVLQQSENPSASTRQTQSTSRTRTYLVPAPNRPTESCAGPNPRPATSLEVRGSLPASAVAPISAVAQPGSQRAAFLVSDHEETMATTELGAAQRDTARELTAKLSSLKGIVWAGLVLFLFGLATMFWAPLRAIVGSVTTSLAITAGGIALMILPTLVVGHELLILTVVGGVVAAWFMAHRHGELRGQVTSLRKAQQSSAEQFKSAVGGQCEW